MEVKLAYEKLLSRAADDAEVAYWTALANNGLADQQLEPRLDLRGTHIARQILD